MRHNDIVLSFKIFQVGRVYQEGLQNNIIIRFEICRTNRYCGSFALQLLPGSHQTWLKTFLDELKNSLFLAIHRWTVTQQFKCSLHGQSKCPLSLTTLHISTLHHHRQVLKQPVLYLTTPFQGNSQPCLLRLSNRIIGCILRRFCESNMQHSDIVKCFFNCFASVTQEERINVDCPFIAKHGIFK